MIKRAFSRPRRARRRHGRLADLAATLVVFAAVALAAGYAPLLRPAATLSGAVRVADGDSLVLDGRRIRLQGVDAPELGQSCKRAGGDYPCGREAREALVRLVGAKSVTCLTRQEDRYGRALATCFAGGVENGVELNRALVEAGWAVAYGDYGDAEDAARRAGRGLWAGSFERPQDWRRIHGGLAEEGHGGLSSLWRWLRSLFGSSV